MFFLVKMANIRDSIEQVLGNFPADISPSKKKQFEESFAAFLRSQVLGTEAGVGNRDQHEENQQEMNIDDDDFHGDPNERNLRLYYSFFI